MDFVCSRLIIWEISFFCSQLERVRLEKDLAERSARRLEERNENLKRAAEEAGAGLREALHQKEILEADVERLRRTVKDFDFCIFFEISLNAFSPRQTEESSHTAQHSRLLEVHNQQLQTSLFDIAQIVLDDADREGGGGGGGDVLEELNNLSIITNATTNANSSKPLARASSTPAVDHASTPIRGRGRAMSSFASPGDIR